jgi:ankyrin repeat protein
MQMVTLLLDHEYNPNKEKCRMKTPPLHLAAMRGRKDIAGLLIERGADVNRKDPFGMTPLTLARQMRRADMEGFLISKGAK